MCVCFTYMYVCPPHACLVPAKVKRWQGIRDPGAEFTGRYGPSYGC